MHKQLVVSAGYDDIERTVIFTGRPMRVRRTPYVADWYNIFLCSVDSVHILTHGPGRKTDKMKYESL